MTQNTGSHNPNGHSSDLVPIEHALDVLRHNVRNRHRVVIQQQTTIVRGSDYSPASELFSWLRKTMTGNNPKLDLVNVDAHKKIGKILSI